MKSSGMEHSLLDTPLSKRSDDDQEMKIWRPASLFLLALRVAAGRSMGMNLNLHEL